MSHYQYHHYIYHLRCLQEINIVFNNRFLVNFLLQFFFQSKKLELNKNLFGHGIGSIIYYNGGITDNSVQNIFYNNENKTIITTEEEKHLFSIIECTFYQIREENGQQNVDNNLISVNSILVTFYMTSCTFNDCHIKVSVLKVTARAQTYSHICSYNLKHIHDNMLEEILLHINSAPNSFVKIYYSSIIGKDEMIVNNRPKGIITIDANISVKLQCMNITNYKNKEEETSGI